MPDRMISPPKRVGETVSLTFNFVSRLAASETVSTQSVTATVYSGVDASPSAIVSGSATNSSGIISQKITAGTSGVTYLLICTITTSAGQTLTLPSFLTVVPDFV